MRPAPPVVKEVVDRVQGTPGIDHLIGFLFREYENAVALSISLNGSSWSGGRATAFKEVLDLLSMPKEELRSHAGPLPTPKPPGVY